MSEFVRLRYLRVNQDVRDENSEVELHPQDFIQPYFVVEGAGRREEISSLKNVFHLSVDELLKDVNDVMERGIDKVLLFGAVDASLYDASGSYASNEHSPVVAAIHALKYEYPGLTVMSDICICGYTDHGHCGVVKGQEILNDESLPYLAGMALAHANAGADYVAPSAMMDGQVAAIRETLNKNGHESVKILSYAAKYASHFYGPFRDAVDSTPAFGDRRTYQMDYRNASQSLQEVAADLQEGAAAVMVKPAHAYMDILFRIKSVFPDVPLAAYHVSGEYMMLHSAADAGVLDFHQALAELFYGLKRSGADWIISYAARDLF